MHNKMQLLFIAMILFANYCDGLIVPDDIHRWKENLFLISSVINGIDSRLGFGFRLGNHADYQSIFEIGPQKLTKPLEKQGKDDYSGNKKRMVRHRVKGAEVPKSESNVNKSYYKKRSFGIKNQYPLPKSFKQSESTKKTEKSVKSIAVQQSYSQHKKPHYRPSSKTTRRPMVIELPEYPVKLKKIQRIKNDSKNINRVN